MSLIVPSLTNMIEINNKAYEYEYHEETYQPRLSERLELLRARPHCYPSEMFPSPSTHWAGINGIISIASPQRKEIILFLNLKKSLNMDIVN